MSDGASNPIGAAEYVQAVIAIEHLESPATQAEVRKAIGSTPGVQTVSLVEGKLHVCYDPLQVSERELEGIIRRSGETPIEGTVERTSPFSDLT